MTTEVPVELIDPSSLPRPWSAIVMHWVLHHPDRVFLPDIDSPGTYHLSWDDLRDILVAAGVLDSRLTPT